MLARRAPGIATRAQAAPLDALSAGVPLRKLWQRGKGYGIILLRERLARRHPLVTSESIIRFETLEEQIQADWAGMRCDAEVVPLDVV